MIHQRGPTPDEARRLVVNEFTDNKQGGVRSNSWGLGDELPLWSVRNLMLQQISMDSSNYTSRHWYINVSLTLMIRWIWGPVITSEGSRRREVWFWLSTWNRNSHSWCCIRNVFMFLFLGFLLVLVSSQKTANYNLISIKKDKLKPWYILFFKFQKVTDNHPAFFCSFLFPSMKFGP